MQRGKPVNSSLCSTWSWIFFNIKKW